MTDTFDAPSFYSLFWNEGYVQRHSSQSTSIEAIRKQFVHFAKEDEANYSQFVAISRLGARPGMCVSPWRRCTGGEVVALHHDPSLVALHRGSPCGRVNDDNGHDWVDLQPGRLADGLVAGLSYRTNLAGAHKNIVPASLVL
eukprot:1161195-Pelagomonas_calceolata.AAC.20